MSNHPNRSAGTPARNPKPAEVRAAREAAGLTQAQAAALVHTNLRAWQRWEADEATTETARRMHPGLWELFRVKAAATMPAGEPGECDLCGERSGRLVRGACAHCRDKFNLE